MLFADLREVYGQNFECRLDEPISLSPPGYVESVVHIGMKAPYEFRLIFLDDKDEATKLRKSQLSIPIHLEMYSMPDHKPVVLKENVTGTQGRNLFEYYERIIASSEQFIEEGDYKVIAYVLQDVPEAAKIPVHLQMSMESEHEKKYFGIDIALGGIFWILIFIDMILVILFVAIKIIQWTYKP
ncbi:hypothetical protein SRRS_11930 [Sporomusa rhizae]|uniref:hypothetical protein n=1 Tax=Sporomusa rhizae TaxID=357999 RepID=UPI00352A068E